MSSNLFTNLCIFSLTAKHHIKYATILLGEVGKAQGFNFSDSVYRGAGEDSDISERDTFLKHADLSLILLFV